jgi:polyketide cyclase/dehydrase/lipid transport protein
VAANDYHFITTWRIAANPAEISSVLGDAAGLAGWWPSVYLRVRVLEEGDELGRGKVVDLWTKGFLPYTLRWRFTVTESDPPNGFRLEASGDFIGRGIWTLEAEARPDASKTPTTLVTYDWLVIAEKGILKNLSTVMKPIFSANHRWAMARGEESLTLELARRRAAADPVVLAAIRRAPGPTFPHNLRARNRRPQPG